MRNRFWRVASIFFMATILRALNLVTPAASSIRKRRSSGLAWRIMPIFPCSMIEYAFAPMPVSMNSSAMSSSLHGVLFRR